jgi:hypothetical protein
MSDDKNKDEEKSDQEIEKEKGDTIAAEGIDYDKLMELLNAQKTTYMKELYPASVSTAMDTASKYFDFLSQQGEVANIRNIQTAWQMNKALADLSTVTNEYYRQESAKGNLWGMAQTSLLNQWANEETGKANEIIKNIWDKGLEEAMPGIRSTTSAYKAAVDQMLEGVIPKDVMEQTRVSAAEAGLSQGRFGGALYNDTARNLGLTSLQIQQQGMNQIPNLMNVTSTLKTPYLMPNVASPNISTNVTKLMSPQFPSAVYSSPYDPAAIQQTYLNNLMLTSSVPPSSYLQSLTTQWDTQLQYQYANTTNALNYSMFQQQMNFARQQRWWDLGGSLLGLGAGAGLAKMFG